MSMHPEKVARLTSLAWLGVVGAAVLAVGVHLLPRADVTVSPPPDRGPTHPVGLSPETAPRGATETVVWMDLEAVMNQIHRVDPVVATTAGEQGRDGTTQEEPDTPTGDEEAPRGVPGWRYVGLISSAGVHTAVLMVESRQHFARAGDSVAGFIIEDVSVEYLLVDTPGGARRVDRELPPEATLTAADRSGLGIPGRRFPGRPQQGDETPEERIERLRGGGR